MKPNKDIEAKPKWMPVNPYRAEYQNGELWDFKDPNLIFDDGVKAGQKKLLEYQILHPISKLGHDAYYLEWLQSMLKQLEASDGR